MTRKTIQGFKLTQTWGVGLINVIKCQSCEKLVNYNGFPPQRCPNCNQEVTKNSQKVDEVDLVMSSTKI